MFQRVAQTFVHTTSSLERKQSRTSRVGAGTVTIVAEEVEHARTSTIVVAAAAFQPRMRRVGEVRVITVPAAFTS